jgi:aspartate aminotransferase-like enzyme
LRLQWLYFETPQDYKVELQRGTYYELRARFGLPAEGRGLLAGKCFRIGHMGYITEKDIDDVLAALQQALPRLGCKPAGVL